MTLYQHNTTKNVAFSSPVCVNDPMIQDIRYDELSPNSLFRLIEDFQWKKSQYRLQENQQEASQWVTKDEVDNRPGWRRLPIHETCIRKPSQDVVLVLMDSYPGGVHQLDSYERTPLHYAVIHGASADIICLLLEAFYDARDVKDFFDKSPKDYIKPDDNEINDAFTQTKRQVALNSGKIKAGISHFAVVNYNDYGYRTPPSKSRAMEALLEEELAQARIESDVAYSERDILMADKDDMRARISELEEKLKKKEEEIVKLADLGERNRALNQLLGKYEKKNKSLVEVKDEKDTRIDNLSKEKDKLKTTISALSEKLTEMTEKNEVEGDSCNSKDTKAHVATLEDELAASVKARDVLVIEVSLLTSSQTISNERIKALEEMVNKLEMGYFAVTDQLVERTRMMHQQTFRGIEGNGL